MLIRRFVQSLLSFQGHCISGGLFSNFFGRFDCTNQNAGLCLVAFHVADRFPHTFRLALLPRLYREDRSAPPILAVLVNVKVNVQVTRDSFVPGLPWTR